jgi:hypothetical protein
MEEGGSRGKPTHVHEPGSSQQVEPVVLVKVDEATISVLALDLRVQFVHPILDDTQSISRA